MNKHPPQHAGLQHTAAALAVATLMAACGGGGSSPADSAAGNTNIASGVASKGPLNGANVCAYAITASAIQGAQIGTCTKTDTAGNYSINLASYAGPILFKAEGGTYTDEATGKTVPLSVALHSLVANSTGGPMSVAITALTELAYQNANAQAGRLSTANIQSATASVQNNFGILDITGTQPVDALKLPANATEAQKNYALALAGVSQYLSTQPDTSLANGLQTLQTCLASPATGCGSGATSVGATLSTALNTFVANHSAYAGLSGSTGRVAFFGSVAAAPSNGADGATGSTGATGAAGASGAAGGIGATGAAGSNGAAGSIGATGATGAIGSAGATGVAGAAGATGSNGTNGGIGATGAAGSTGAAGANGTNGSIGATGATGAIGNAGATGAAGAAGGIGATGATGAIGNAGATGVAGAAGATGLTGAVGSNGAAGANGTNGSIGATGAAGAAGGTGLTGAAGSNGTNGSVGATGATGAIGNAGATGAAGAAGATGLTGAAGANGANGLKTLVVTVAEPNGMNCPLGGTKVTSGLDQSADGTLQLGEVTSTSYVCNGVPGLQGLQGVAGPGVTWVEVTGTTQTAAANKGYMANNASRVTLTLPSSTNLTVGDVIQINGVGAGGWKIVPNSAQSIITKNILGSFFASTTGFISGGQYAAIELQYVATNTFSVLNSAGNIFVDGGGSLLPTGYVAQGGLTWVPVSSTTYTYANAATFCSSSFNGLTGWRLPTQTELSALYSSGAMNGQGWTLSNTWLSTPNGTAGHYGVGLNNGNVFSIGDMFGLNVTCVR